MKDLDKIRVAFKKEGYAIIQYDDSPVHSYPYDAPWLTDKKFTELYEKMRRNTLVDRQRCYSLYLLIQQAKAVPGDVLEVGTWRGGTAAILTSLAPGKTVYVADTFEGIVKSSEWEHYTDKRHSDTSERLVDDFLKDDIKVSNFKILKGIFPEETGTELADKKLSFVYLDLDVYLSTKDAFNFIWDQVSPSGIVVFDDYGMVSACSGISKFVDEIRDDKDKLFIQSLNGQAYIIKRQI